VRSDRDLGLKKEDGELLQLSGQRVQGNPNTSLSGHERNHLFMNKRGKQFTELSPLSGLDHSGDSRAFAVLDFDRDGMLDIALVNANAPRFQIFKNQHHKQIAGDAGKFVAFRFVGGNNSPDGASGWSAIDAVGTRVNLRLGDLTLTREYAVGRGLAAQNSSTLLIGIGTHQLAESVTITWPSGRTTELGDLQEGSLYTVYENASQSPDASGLVTEPYRLNLQSATQRPSIALPTPRFQPEVVANKQTTPKLRIYTAMATWCASCKRELPQVQRLTDMFTDDEIEFYGVGIDVAENTELLESYVQNSKPAYELLTGLDDQIRTEFKEYLEETLKSEALPCSVITSSDGRILRTMFAIPSVSELRGMLNGMSPN
jgi:thiol-disulfide isomerase/thioredoxin